MIVLEQPVIFHVILQWLQPLGSGGRVTPPNAWTCKEGDP